MAVERVEERLSLHELLRVGLARQEDLCLMQQVVYDDNTMPVSSAARLFKECVLREEWRVQRELQLLERLRACKLSSVNDPDRVQAMLRQLEHQIQGQSMVRKPAGSQTSQSHPSTDRRAPTITSLPTHSSLGAALKLYTSPMLTRSASATSRARSQSNSGQLSTVNTPIPQALKSRPSNPYRQPPTASGKAALDTPQLLTTDELRRHLSLPSANTLIATTTLTNTASLSRDTRGLQRPASSQQQRSSAGVNPVLHVSPSSAASTTPGSAAKACSQASTPAHRPVTSPAFNQGSAKPPTTEQPRFQKLLRLQGTLVAGLQQHAEAGGFNAACNALQESVANMQKHFQSCLADGRQLLGIAASGLPDHTPPAAFMYRPKAWSQLLLLGQLGLTSANIARLQHIKRSIAARRVQCAVRAYLRRLQHARAVAEAAAQAAKAAERLRHHAAIIIQRYWRGYCGRCAARHRQQQVIHERREATVGRVQRFMAALRIQRAWRTHRKRRRATRALTRAPQSQPTSAAANGQDTQHSTSVAARPASSLQAYPVHTAHPPDAHMIAAVVKIQAAVRGWLVRRSTALWWTCSLGRLRQRRAAHRTWQAVRGYLLETSHLQDQFCESITTEAAAEQAIAQDAHAEQHKFEAAWRSWLTDQHLIAVSQPLPRGWVPHPLPGPDGGDGFLDTRSGALHAHHPAVLQLRAFAASQRAQAEEQMLQRHATAAASLELIRVEASHQRSALMAAMHASLAQHLQQASAGLRK